MINKQGKHVLFKALCLAMLTPFLTCQPTQPRLQAILEDEELSFPDTREIDKLNHLSLKNALQNAFQDYYDESNEESQEPSVELREKVQNPAQYLAEKLEKAFNKFRSQEFSRRITESSNSLKNFYVLMCSSYARMDRLEEYVNIYVASSIENQVYKESLDQSALLLKAFRLLEKRSTDTYSKIYNRAVEKRRLQEQRLGAGCSKPASKTSADRLQDDSDPEKTPYPESDLGSTEEESFLIRAVVRQMLAAFEVRLDTEKELYMAEGDEESNGNSLEQFDELKGLSKARTRRLEEYLEIFQNSQEMAKGGYDTILLKAFHQLETTSFKYYQACYEREKDEATEQQEEHDMPREPEKHQPHYAYEKEQAFQRHENEQLLDQMFREESSHRRNSF